MRPLPRRFRPASVDRQGAAGRARARVPHGARGDALSRHVRRRVVQARLAARRRRRAAAREPRGRRAGAGRMDTGHAAARSRCAAPERSRSRRRSTAADIAPGMQRTFGFQKLAWYDGPTWQRIRQRARDRMRPAPSAPSIFASDIDPRAVEQCRRNAAAAGVASWIDIGEADVLARRAPAPAGLLVANPPYGVRLDDDARAGGVLSEAGRCAEAALRRLDRVPPDRRRAAREADRPQAVEANAALQRRHRVPPVPLRDRGGTAAARAARRPAASAPDDKIRVPTTVVSLPRRRHADAPLPPLRIRPHAVHSRDEGKEAGASSASSGRAARSGGTSGRRISRRRR